MPQEDKDVLIASIIFPHVEDSAELAQPMDTAARLSTEAIKLHGVEYNMSAWDRNLVDVNCIFCLSSNPEHLVGPPSMIEIFDSEATYAIYKWDGRAAVAGTDNGYARMFNTGIIPLYGLIVPRRQIVCLDNNMGSTIKMRANIYYSIVQKKSDIIETLNRQRGKYRRT